MRTNEAADKRATTPAGISFPVLDQRMYITPARVNDAPSVPQIKPEISSIKHQIENESVDGQTYPVGTMVLEVTVSSDEHHNLQWINPNISIIWKIFW